MNSLLIRPVLTVCLRSLDATFLIPKRRRQTVCSFEIISQISQPASSVFLSQKISQQYFQPAKSAQANRPKDFATKGNMVTAILVVHAKFSFSPKVFQPVTSNV
jgi:hypothetical protein